MAGAVGPGRAPGTALPRAVAGLIEAAGLAVLGRVDGIVSSGLDTTQVYDMDKIRLQMENEMLKQEPLAPGGIETPATGDSPGSGLMAPTPEPAAPTDPDANRKAIDNLFKQPDEKK